MILREALTIIMFCTWSLEIGSHKIYRLFVCLKNVRGKIAFFYFYMKGNS